MFENDSLVVSVCIVAYNEETVLPNLMQNIISQDYPHEKMEIVLVDSNSTDNTKEIMRRFREEQKDFKNIQVLDNPKQCQAAGWNVAIRHYTGDIITRIDAHASIPSDFVSENVKLLIQGEYITGGPRPNIIDESTPWKDTLLLAEQSMFGSSIAKYRRGGEKVYVKSLFHGSYRREVFENVGGFDEQLGRTEDNELHYRIRKAGYKICFSPNIISYQYARNSLRKMLKQKYGNGFWVALTLKACPRCLSIYHFVPLGFVLAIILTGIMAVMGSPFLAIFLWGSYWGLAITMGLVAVRGEKKNLCQLLLPFLFFLLHISYGVGSLMGLAKLPFWHYEHKDYLKE